MTEPVTAPPRHGWILYDGDCPLCTGLTEKFGPQMRGRGFELLPLQTPWVMERLGLKPGMPLDEMKLLTPAGDIFGGHYAAAQIASRIWWAWPFYTLSRLPGMDPLLARGYRWMADRRQHVQGNLLVSLSPFFIRIIRYVIASVWLFHGLFGKLLGLIPRHQLIVARILGEEHSYWLTKAIGVGEIMLALWMASGIAPKRCVALQTLLLITMNVLEIRYAADLLLTPAWMAVANGLLLLFGWLVIYGESRQRSISSSNSRPPRVESDV